MDWGADFQPTYTTLDRTAFVEFSANAAKMAAVRTSMPEPDAAQFRWSDTGASVRIKRSEMLVEVSTGHDFAANQVFMGSHLFDLIRKMVATYPSDTVQVAVVTLDGVEQYLSIRDGGRLNRQDFRLYLRPKQWEQQGVTVDQFAGMPPAIGPWLDAKEFNTALRVACLPRTTILQDHRVLLVPTHGGLKIVGASAGTAVCRLLSEHGPALPATVVLTGDTVETVRKAVPAKGRVRLGTETTVDRFDLETVRLTVSTGTNRIAVTAGGVEERAICGAYISHRDVGIINQFAAAVENTDPVCELPKRVLAPAVRRLALGATVNEDGIVRFEVADSELVMTRWKTLGDYSRDQTPQTVETIPVDADDVTMPAVSAKRLHQMLIPLRTPTLELRSGNGKYHWMALSEPGRGWWTGLLGMTKLEDGKDETEVMEAV